MILVSRPGAKAAFLGYLVGFPGLVGHSDILAQVSGLDWVCEAVCDPQARGRLKWAQPQQGTLGLDFLSEASGDKNLTAVLELRFSTYVPEWVTY